MVNIREVPVAVADNTICVGMYVGTASIPVE